MRYIYLIIVCTFCISLQGQSFHESLRYSMLDYGSTARNAGAGGSMSALGADFSAGAMNPAGFAEFRKSEFLVSISGLNNETSSSLRNNTPIDDSKHSIYLNNLGIVFNSRPIASAWKTSNFVISFNKIANFSNRFRYGGSTEGSITERFVSLSEGLNPDQLDNFAAGPAYTTGAIFDFDEDNSYETDFEDFSYQVQKDQLVESKGGINELSFGYAGNFEEKLSIGISFGVPFVSYDENKFYLESDDTDLIPFFDDLQYNEFLRISGVGINGKFGIILKPVKKLRLGVSMHSPTIFFLTEDFSTDITYSYTDNDGAQSFTEPSPEGNFKYRINTAWRGILSAGYIFDLGDVKGFVSGEVEYVDYSKNKFNLTANSDLAEDRELEEDLNQKIDDRFNAVNNIRLGVELAYQNLRFRTGYSIENSPYKSGKLLESKIPSAGLGWRGNQFYIDMAVRYHSSENSYIPYNINDNSRLQTVEIESNKLQYLISLGIKI